MCQMQQREHNNFGASDSGNDNNSDDHDGNNKK